MESYRLVHKASVGAEIESLPRPQRALVVSRILALEKQPRPHASQKLAGFESRYRLRQGAYRIIYEVDDRAKLVRVVKVGHRREVYR